MRNYNATIMLEDIDLEQDKDLLQVINKVNDSVKLKFELQIEDIVDMFKFYIKENIENLYDFEEYDCIMTEIKKDNDEYYLTLNFIDDEDSQSDIDYLLRELKRHFGINFINNCALQDLFRILLMQCSDYDIIEDKLIIKIYYETYKISWLKQYFEYI